MDSLLLFDGLGGNTDDLLVRLRALAARPENAAFFATVYAAADAVVDHIGEPGHQVLPEGIPLKAMVSGRPRRVASSAAECIVTGLCMHIYQLCHLQPTLVARSAARAGVAAIGHSLGLQAAIVAGMRLTRMDEFLEQCRRSVAVVALGLIRSHQVGTDAATVGWLLGPSHRPRVGGGEPTGATPMAAVTGIGPDALRGLLESHNEDQHVDRRIELSLVNSPRFQVLSGRTADLLDLFRVRRHWLDSRLARWDFLANTAPFHSSHLAPAVRLIAATDQPLIGTPTSGSRLRMPVYATDTPRDLRDAEDLASEFVELALVRPLNWPATVEHAIKHSAPLRAVDFGPGPGARTFTRDCLRGRARPLPYVPATPR